MYYFICLDLYNGFSSLLLQLDVINMIETQKGPLSQDRLPPLKSEETETTQPPTTDASGKAAAESSLLTENRQLKAILPSYKPPEGGKLARLIQKIKELIAKILAYFFPVTKPDYCAVVGALDRTPSPLAPQQMVSHLKQFFKDDQQGSDSVKECLRQLEKQIEALELNQSRVTGLVKMEKQIRSLAREISSLKEGKMKVVLVSNTPGDQIFYLFTATKTGIDFKIIGRGGSLAKIADHNYEIDVAGRVKLPTVIHYSNIDRALFKDRLWLETLLAQSEMSLEAKSEEEKPFKGGFSASAVRKLTARLASYRQPVAESEWATKTDSFAKTVLGLLKQVDPALSGKKESRRLLLKAEMGALFQALRQHGDKLKLQGKEFMQLESMLRTLSQQLLRAHQKGYISKKELGEVVSELTLVQNRLENIKQEKVASISKAKMGKASYNLPASATSRPPTQLNGASPPILDGAAGRAPIAKPATASFPELRPQEWCGKRFEEAGTPKEMIDLLDGGAPQSVMVEWILRMEFSPYAAEYDYNRHYDYNNGEKGEVHRSNPNSFWNQISRQSAPQLLQQLGHISERLVTEATQRGEVSIDLYQAVAKISLMVLYLGQKHLSENRVLLADSLGLKERLAAIIVPSFMHRHGVTWNSITNRNYLMMNRFYQRHHWKADPHQQAFAPEQGRSFPQLERQLEHLRALMPLGTWDWHEGSDDYNGRGRFSLRSTPTEISYWGQLSELLMKGELPALPLPLLGPYAGLRMYPSSKSTADILFNQERGFGDMREFAGWGADTPEAMYGDPEGVAELFANKVRTYNGLRRAEVDDKRHPDLLSPDMQEELTPLLLLLNENLTREELVAFFEKHETLLDQPFVRNFVWMLFCQRGPETWLSKGSKPLPAWFKSKIEQLAKKAGKDHTVVERLLFFVRLNDFLRDESCRGLENDEKDADKSNVVQPGPTAFYQGGEKLVQDLLARAERDPEWRGVMESLLTLDLTYLLQKEQLSGEEIMRMMLHYQLLKGTMTDPQRGSALARDPSALWWIETRYRSLVERMMAKQNHPALYNYLADTICAKRKLPLEEGGWTMEKGLVLKSETGRYQIELLTGKISLGEEGQFVLAALPDEVLNDPLFKEAFSGLNLEEMRVTMQERPGGVAIYLFQDREGRPCRAEVEKSVVALASQQADGDASNSKADPWVAVARTHETRINIAYYKTFPERDGLVLQVVPSTKAPEPLPPEDLGTPKWLVGKLNPALQSVPMMLLLVLKNLILPSGEKISGFPSRVKELLKWLATLAGLIEREKVVTLPFLFNNGCYLDPSDSTARYGVGEDGKIFFKVACKPAGDKLQVESVIDYRGKEPSAPMQLTSGTELPDQSLLKGLTQIEDLSQMLIWGQDGKIEKIELPRYGLTFAVEDDALVCTNKEYEGYRPNLSATVQERKGLTFSLLLEHPDRTKVKKLVLPPAEAILSEIQPQANTPPVVARLVRMIQIVIRLLLHRALLAPQLVTALRIDNQSKIKPVILDLQHHTEEILYSEKERGAQFMQIFSLALRLGKYEFADQLLARVPLKKEDLTKEQLLLIKNFLQKANKEGGAASALGLKMIAKLKRLIRGDKKYRRVAESFRELRISLMKSYLASLGKQPKIIELDPVEFTKLTVRVKRADAEFYSHHLFPFFLEKNQEWRFPIRGEVAASKSEDMAIPSFDLEEANQILEAAEKLKRSNLSGFDHQSPDPEQILTYFGPIYQLLRQERTNEEQANKVKLAIALSLGEGEGVAAKVCTLLHQLLRARENGQTLSELPSPVALRTLTSGQLSQDLLNPITQWLTRVEDNISTNEKKSVVPEIKKQAPFSGKDRLAELRASGRDERKKAKKEEVTLEELEKQIDVETAVPLAGVNLEYRSSGEPLLFTKEQLASYFNEEPVAMAEIPLPEGAGRDRSHAARRKIEEFRQNIAARKRRNHFTSYSLTKAKELARDLNAKVESLATEREQAKVELNRLVRSSEDPVEQITLLAGHRKVASDTDLLMALLEEDGFARLEREHLLPRGRTAAELKAAVIRYYDLEVRYNLALVCRETARKMESTGESAGSESWKRDSALLQAMLRREQRYNKGNDSKLLVFEAFAFITFRELDGGQHQIQLLHDLLEDPSSVTQAGTGSGKTFLLSVLRALLMANGKRLVTLQVLPPLYRQTVNLLRERLSIFGARDPVHEYCFSMQQPLTEWGIDPKTGEKKEVSIFRRHYREFLHAIRDRKVVVSDYKSFSLLEEKYLSLTQDFFSLKLQGSEPKEIQLDHWVHLRKIRRLLKRKEFRLMDEFDGPNRPRHRIQLPLKGGKPPKPKDWLPTRALQLFELLKDDPDLGMKKGLQGRRGPAVRMKAMRRVAAALACSEFVHKRGVSEKEVMDYLFGENEEIRQKIDAADSNWSGEEKDAIAFFKDQFCTYLPLTLGKKEKTDYQVNKDGNGIVPATKGEAHHGSKFGSILEQYNYWIAASLRRVPPKLLEKWISDQRDLWRQQNPQEKDSCSARDELRRLFPGKFQHLRDSYPIETLVSEINGDPQRLWYFVGLGLRGLTTSDATISMNPQNNVSQARRVQALSATVGELDALHRQFTKNREAVGRVQAEQAERMASGARGFITYDPASPLGMLAEQPSDIVVDGAGAFAECDPEAVVDEMFRTNPGLKWVAFHNAEGKVQWKQNGSATGDKEGFYFRQAFTTGDDQSWLKPDLKALVTVDDQGTMEGWFQERGRLRGGQKFVIAAARPAGLRNLGETAETKLCFEAEQQAQDIYQAKLQEQKDIVREQGLEKLLDEKDWKIAVNLFEQMRSLFVQDAAPTYENPGDYYRLHAAIPRKDEKPKAALTALQARLINQCENEWKIPVLEVLRNLTYSEAELERMPAYVPPETGVEIEEEQEQDVALEEELLNEVEFDMEEEQQLETHRQKNRPAPFYLPWLWGEGLSYSFGEKTGLSYDPKVRFTDHAVPLSRGTRDPIHKRKLFDNRMPRLGTVHVVLNEHTFQIESVTMGDVLDQGRVKKEYLEGERQKVDALSFIYDTRTGWFLGPGYDHSWESHEELFKEMQKRCPDWKEIRQKKVDQRWNPPWEERGYKKNELLEEYANREVMKRPEFHKLIAQLKFLDGQLEQSDYTEGEWKELGQWLKSVEPQERQRLHRQMKEEILRYRPANIMMGLDRTSVGKLLLA